MVSEIGEEIYEIYLKQDYENNLFDVIFYVDGKELYAHGQVLALASPVLKKQLLKNRSKGNQPIQIDKYTYDEFKEFVRLLYCFEDCYENPMDKTKLFPIIELAHIYKTDGLTGDAAAQLASCGGFRACRRGAALSVNDIKDIFEKLEFGAKYSLENFKEAILFDDLLCKCLTDLCEYDGFGDLEKFVVEAFLTIVLTDNNDVDQKEKLCKAIYKWGKHQAMVNDEMPEEEKRELIFYHIEDILEDFEFDQMRPKFLFEFAVPNGLISIDEAREYATIEVCIRSSGKKVTGSFIDEYGIYEIIESNEHKRLIDRGEKKRCFWDKTIKRPSKPSELKKMKGCNWYLALDINGKLNLKHHSLIARTDYLLAEMKPKDGAVFTLDKNYNFYATVSR